MTGALVAAFATGLLSAQQPGTVGTTGSTPRSAGDSVAKPAQSTTQVTIPVGVAVGGFLQTDWRSFVRDSTNKYTNDFTIRRLRVDLAGHVSKFVAFHIQPDFAGSKVTINDAYADLSVSPALTFRVGKAKVPLSLERAQQTPANVFVEQGATLAIAPNYDVGAQLLGTIVNGVFFYDVGIFNGIPDGANVDDDTDDSKDVAGRVQITPFAWNKNVLVHGLTFGGGGTYGKREGLSATPETPSYKTAAQLTFLSYLSTVVANGTTDRLSAYGADYAGPVSISGEWIRSRQALRSTSTATPPVVTTGTLENHAYQVYGTLVLTGENASYRGVTPRNAFDPSNGHWGAVELVARYDQFKADDSTAAPFVDLTKSATTATSRTVGVNWYLTNKVRAEVNYQYTTFVHGTTTGNRTPERVILTRLQTVF